MVSCNEFIVDGRICICKWLLLVLLICVGLFGLFIASWCKSCQKFGQKYKKLALNYGDLRDPRDRNKVVDVGKVRFAEVEFNANAKLCRSLGIKRLPYVHFYRGKEGRLAEFSAGPSKFNLVTDMMHELLASSKEERAFNIMMQEGEDLGQFLVTELTEQHWKDALAEEKSFKNTVKKLFSNHLDNKKEKRPNNSQKKAIL